MNGSFGSEQPPCLGCGPERSQAAAGFLAEEGAGSKGEKNDSVDREIQMCEIVVRVGFVPCSCT